MCSSPHIRTFRQPPERIVALAQHAIEPNDQSLSTDADFDAATEIALAAMLDPMVEQHGIARVDALALA